METGAEQPQPGVLSALREARSGIAFVYDLLDRLRSVWNLDDAVLVVVDDQRGRQAFRLGRQPITRGWAATVATEHPAGLHVRPETEIPERQRRLVVGLAALALQMDVLRHRSLSDAMTGLFNRGGFEERLAAVAERARRFEEPFALVLIDLDGFKAINDGFGHAVGDRVLAAVGQTLRQVVRTVDVAARVGGDEFALLLTRTRSVEAPAVLDRVRQAIREIEAPLPLSASIGWACWSTDSADLVELYELADRRLYRAKLER